MSESNPGRCRVALHAGSAHLDLELPTGLPVAALIPAIVDILAPPTEAPGPPYRLHQPGLPALDGAQTLAQHGIRDGTVLLLTRTLAALPAPRFDDAAEQVAATVRANARPFTASARRATAALAGTGLAGVAGFVAVPGGPGAPNALLAAAAAGAVALLTAQFGGGTGPALTAVCVLAVLVTAAALIMELTGASVPTVGAVAATAALGLLQAASWAAIIIAGLPRQPGPPAAGLDARAVRGAELLAGFVVAGSAAVTLGACGAATGTQPSGVAFAAVAGAALLLQARAHLDRIPITALAAGGITALGTALIVGATLEPRQRLWLSAAAAALAAGALYAGFADRAPAAPARRGAEVLEYAVLIVLVPLACWSCGWFDTVRSLPLG